MSPSDAPIQVGELCEGIGYSGTPRRGTYERAEGADALLAYEHGTWRVQLGTLRRLPSEPETPPLFGPSPNHCSLCGLSFADVAWKFADTMCEGIEGHSVCSPCSAKHSGNATDEIRRRKSRLSRGEPEKFSPGDWVDGESSEDKTLGVSMRGKFVRRCDDSMPNDSVIDIGNGEEKHHYVRTSTMRRAGDPTPEKLAPASSGESPRVSTVSDATARVVPNETPSGHSQPSPPEPSIWGIPREREPLDLRDLAAADERFVTKLENMTDRSSRYGNLANSDDPLDRLAASRMSRREGEGEVASEDKRDPWDWDADDAEELTVS